MFFSLNGSLTLAAYSALKTRLRLFGCNTRVAFGSSSNKSLNQVGVVFGCIKMIENYNYTPFYYTLNIFMDIFYYGTWVFGVSFIISLAIGILNFNKENEKSHKQMSSIVKQTLIIALISAILTGIFVFILSRDIPAFYENGVKKIVDI